jgi:acyl carrier protein
MLEELQDVFRTTFEDDDLVISRSTTANDVVGWDSLTHVTLLVSLEERFGIRFKSSEVADLKNVGELADLVERYRGKQA